MFCTNCGSPLGEGVKFCPHCGTAVAAFDAAQRKEKEPEAQTADPFTVPAAPKEPEPVYAGSGAVRQGIPAPGFSDRVNHPEILAAMKKNRRAAKLFALFFVPLPLVGLAVYSAVSGKLELGQAVRYGGFLSAVFLVFALIGFARDRAKNTYEAVVTDQKEHSTYRHNNSENRESIMEYITVAKTTDGRKKKIVEREGSQIWAYHYLNVGDRFRYHPQFHFPYELYDKAKAPYIACVSCGTKNPVEADRCKKCRLPLLK